jgi:hypothetical protein
MSATLSAVQNSRSAYLRWLTAVCAAAVLLIAPLLSVASAQAPAVHSAPSTGCGVIQTSTAKAPCLRLSYQGEVAAGQSFSRELGEDLVFRLNPEPASGGWFIEVVPAHATAGTHQEYVWVVTPPYHFGNPRYLDTSYGISAREAVRTSPREFNFVLDEQQYQKAAQLVDLAVSSHPQDDPKSQQQFEQDGREAMAALMNFPVARGRLWISDSRVKGAARQGDLGSIEWIKFKVELRVPCGFAVVIGTGKISLDSSACPELQGDKLN